jgi:hypothetical protein
MLARVGHLGSSVGQVTKACFSTVQDKDALKALNTVIIYLNSKAQECKDQSVRSLQESASVGAVSLREESYYRILSEHLEGESWKVKVELERKPLEAVQNLPEAYLSVVCKK